MYGGEREMGRRSDLVTGAFAHRTIQLVLCLIFNIYT